MKYSVVIISLNEENNIQRCINSIMLTGKKDVQIILSDGGSSDNTIQLALNENIEVVNSTPGRGIQFNTGAANADGDVILFLHADTTLPENAFKILDKYFNSIAVKTGTFRLAFDKKSIILSFYTKLTSYDSFFTKFGDQCIVVRKDFFNQLNGFKNWSLFEDVDLLRRARKITKIHSFPASVTTSSRRFETNGIIKQQILNGWHLLQFLFGKSPAKLSRYYNKSGFVNKEKNSITKEWTNRNKFNLGSNEK